jgi:hypothetical protein
MLWVARQTLTPYAYPSQLNCPNLSILFQVPPPGRKLLILGTTSIGNVVEEMGIVSAFNVVLHVPLLREPEIKAVVGSLGAFTDDEVRFWHHSALQSLFLSVF